MISFTAHPLDKYSSQHHISLFSLLGINAYKSLSLTMAFNFNLTSSFKNIPKTQLTFHLRDENSKQIDTADFCINNFKRWRLSIAEYESFENYIQKLKSNHKKNYHKSQKIFLEYGATINFINGDWSEYADAAYELYVNVAKRHGSKLYDLSFFRKIAKIDGYNLICIWHRNSLISVLVIFDEEPVYHSMVCGFDYEHSKNIYAYSILHYELIRIAIAERKYSMVDAGITGDKAKSMMNFKPINSCMDVNAKNFILKRILRLISLFLKIIINEEGKLKFKILTN